jgi:pimeloyl-ACP methyl ester carboxylesterase
MSLKLLAALAIAAVAAVAILGYFRLKQQPRFPYMAHALPAASYDAMAARPGWKGETLEVAPGVRLRGLVREPSGPGQPWVLFFDGNSGTMLRDGQEFLDALCADTGWGGAVWAYRGFDSSDGTPDADAFVDDGVKAYGTLLERRGVSPGDVHVVGFSMGTGVAAGVAARAAPHGPATLTLLAPMTVLYHGERTQLLLERHETLKWLPAVTSPVLVIHGLEDATLPVENGRAVATALGARARLVELPGVGHDDVRTAPAAQAALRGFISSHRRAGATE